MLSSSPTILITGGSGFFGSNAAQILRLQGYNVICTSSEPSKYAAYSEFALHSLRALNITDTASVQACVEAMQPTAIVHAAAFSAPLACEREPERAHAVNAGGTRNVLHAAQMLDVPVIFLSTDLVFNGDRDTLRDGAYTEADTPNARIVYGKSKIAAERVLQEHSFGKWIILRTSLMFGGRVAWASGFPQFAIDQLQSGNKSTLFLDQYRTSVYIPDIARAICSFVENIVENNLFCGKVRGKRAEVLEKPTHFGQTFFGQIFHCGGSERLNRVEFVERCCAILGVETAQILAKCMEEVPDYTTRVRDVSLDSSALKKAFAWEQTPLEKAFTEMKTSFGMVF